METYRPRRTQDSVLVQLLRRHLDAFIEEAAADGGSKAWPFVERQLRAMVTCGDVTAGFIRLECERCRGPRVVPLSCKARLCPSCAGRRMNEQAAHLVDRVLPRAPYRQWVLTLPRDLAWVVAYDGELSRRVFGLLAQELARWQCERARAAGVVAPHAGSVVEVQRFADGARCWPHAHLLAPDGVFNEEDDGSVRFVGLGPPRDRDVSLIVARVSRRVARLLRRRCREATEAGGDVELRSRCAKAEPCGRIAEAGASDGPSGARGQGKRSAKRLCARSPEGIELHAAVRVKASDRKGLERLCRYLARPAIASERLSWTDDGRIEFRLKRTWKGGVRALLFEPKALIARLVALIPLPRTKARRFHGVFAPNHRLRGQVVPRPPTKDQAGHPVAPQRPARMGWADLLRRVWNIDALRCSWCEGRLRVIALIRDPTVVEVLVAAVQQGRWAAPTATTRGPP